MNDMVERVAKAICAAFSDKSWEELGPHWQSVYQTEARAAIEAMREPTGAMLTAMRLNLGGTDQLHIDEAEEAWRKGIDAALTNT